MRTRTICLLAAGLGLVTALGGCDAAGSLTPDPDETVSEELSTLLSSTTEEGAITDAAADTATRSRRRGQSVFRQLAELIPGFGGLYRTGHCAVALVLTDLSEAESAIGIVKAVVEPLVEQGCPDGIRVEARAGQYTYLQLLRVRHALGPLRQIRGVVGARIDFQQNKVIISITTREVLDDLRRALERIGVPRDAVGVELVTRGDRR